MSRLVEINLGRGNLEEGFALVTVRLDKTIQLIGNLPPASELKDIYHRWQFVSQLNVVQETINQQVRESNVLEENSLEENNNLDSNDNNFNFSGGISSVSDADSLRDSVENIESSLVLLKDELDYLTAGFDSSRERRSRGGGLCF